MSRLIISALVQVQVYKTVRKLHYLIKINILIMRLSCECNLNQIWPPGELVNKQTATRNHILIILHPASLAKHILVHF